MLEYSTLACTDINSKLMEWLIDIIKVVIPMGLLVLMAYVLLSQFFRGQLRLKSIELQRDRKKDVLELKLNAYERLALYLERITFPDMIMRLNTGRMEARTMYTSLLMTIQKEYEHNLSQQVYISEQLWQIVRLTKQEMSNLVTDAFSEDDEQSLDEYINRLLVKYAEWKMNPVETAKSAVRQEAALLL